VIWVLIDLSYLAHRARCALHGLEHEDYPTGVIFGFLEQLRSICTDPKVLSNRVALFADSKKSHRKQSFPEYKQKRVDNRTEEEREQISIMWDQVRLLQTKILPESGFKIYRQVGLESDDLIAMAASQFEGTQTQAIMVTSDGDLYQCIRDSVHWYDPSRGTCHNPASFLAARGISPHRWGEVKSIAGCSSDGVPGIQGVGEQTAVKYLTGCLPSRYKTYQAITSENGQRIVARNKPLVILPHERTKTVDLREPRYNPGEFFDLCKRYGIVSYLQGPKRNAWIRFFHGHKRIRFRRR